MTALGGAAAGYGSLFLARLGVGASEAGLTPAAHSLLADVFARARLPLAMGLYSMGTYLGNGLALLAGGWLVRALVGRRVVFVTMGALGVLFVLGVSLLREPARTEVARSPAMSQVGRQLRARGRAYRSLFAAFALMILVGAGCAALQEITPDRVRGRVAVGALPLAALLLHRGMTHCEQAVLDVAKSSRPRDEITHKRISA